MTAWSELSRGTEVLEVAGVPLRILGLVPRTFHVATHAGQHGPGGGHVLEDLARAANQVPIEAWRDAAILAERLSATSAMRAGLALDPKGTELLKVLSISRPQTVDSQLLSASLEPWPLNIALALEWASRQPGTVSKFRTAWRHALRSPAWMREHDTVVRDGVRGLSTAYSRRLTMIIKNLPAAARAWREARQKSGRL